MVLTDFLNEPALMNLLFCGGGACHRVPGDSLQGTLSLSALIAWDAFPLSTAHTGLVLGEEEETRRVFWVMKDGFKNRQK